VSLAPVLAMPGWADRLIWAGVVILVAVVLHQALQRLVRRWAREPAEHTADLRRLRRRETAAAFVIAAIRYLIAIAAGFALIGIFTRSPLTALGGASLIVILVGFAIQRFLTDVVAGTLALFENLYGVGDFITVDPSGLAGIVDELGLRTTVLRGLNGDRYIIPNSQITAVRRSERGYRTYNIEILSHDPDRVEHAVSLVASYAPDGEARFLRPPGVVDRQELEHELWLVRVRATVPPTLEWLAEDYLVNAISRQAGEALVGEPVAYTLDSAALRRYKARLVVR
jgi:small conductance mechanosensitive channel